MIGYDLNGFGQDDPNVRMSVQDGSSFGLGWTNRTTEVKSITGGNVATSKGAKDARPFKLNVMIYATSDAQLEQRLGAWYTLLEQDPLILGRTVDGTRTIATVTAAGPSDPDYDAASHTAKVSVILTLVSVYWRDPAASTVALPNINDYNAVLNPSPQDATQGLVGFSAVLNGGTLTRVAGAGVGGGYGARGTATTDLPPGVFGVQVGDATSLNVKVAGGDLFDPSTYVNANLTRSARLLWEYYDNTNTIIGARRIGTQTVALVANAPHIRIQEPVETAPAGTTHALIRAYDPVNGWAGTRTNLFVNPGLRANTGWAVFSGTGGTSTRTYVASGGPDNLPYVTAAWSVAATGGSDQIAVDSSTPVGSFAAGDTAATGVWVMSAVARSVGLKFDWNDSSNAYISSNAGAVTALAAGVWTYIPYKSPAAPANASKVAVYVVPSGGTGHFTTADQISVTKGILEKNVSGAAVGSYLDGASGTNVHPNPELAVDATGWTASASTTASRQTTGAPSGFKAANWFRAVANALNSAQISVTTNTNTATVAGSTSYTFSADVASDYIGFSGVRIAVNWNDASGAYISTSTGTGAALATAGIGERRSATFTSPANATRAFVVVQFVSPTAQPAGSYVGVTAVRAIASTGYLTDDIEYVDPHPKAWTGTANASTSTRAGDTMTIDRVSTLAGDYIDGSFGTQPNGDVASWESTPYASRTVVHRTSKNATLTALADSSGPIDDALILVPGATASLTSFSLQDDNSVSGISWTSPAVAVGSFLSSFATDLANANHIAVDSATGDVWIASQASGTIERYSSTGTLLLTLTGYPATDIRGLAFKSGVLYIALYTAGNVVKYTVATALSVTIPTGVNPQGIAVDSAGNIYVGTSATSGQIKKMTNAGAAVTTFSVTGIFWNIAIDASDVLYLSDGNNGLVRKYSATGTASGTWATAYGTSQTFFVAVDLTGKVYTVGFTSQTIVQSTNAGIELARWGSVGSGAGQTTQARAIAFDAQNNGFVIDASLNRVNKYDGDGVFNGIGAGQWLRLDPKNSTATIVASASFTAAGDDISKGVSTVPWAGKKLSLRSKNAVGDLFGTKTMSLTLKQTGGAPASVLAAKAYL